MKKSIIQRRSKNLLQNCGFRLIRAVFYLIFTANCDRIIITKLGEDLDSIGN